MIASDLMERVIIEKRVDARDNRGDPVPAWTNFATRWAKIDATGGTERWDNRQETQTLTHSVEMRYLPGARTKWRALWRRGEQTTLKGAVTAAGTTFVVNSATEFPNDAPYLVLVGAEVVKVTSGMGTTSWTVSRAQDGTTGRAHGTGARVHLLVPMDIVAVAHERRRLTRLGCVEREHGNI